MFLAYVFKLYPTPDQEQGLTALLETHRRLYNQALAQRKLVFETEGRSVSYREQSALLKSQRQENQFLALANFSSCQATLRRLDRAFAAFFRRVKSGEKAGYPRFQGYGRFDSIAFPKHGDGCKLDVEEKRVYLQAIGHIKVKLHREVEGDLKTLRLLHKPDGWHLVLTCQLPEPQVEPSPNPEVGIDLGLKSFLVTSEGEAVPAPKFYRKSHAKLRRAQRALARCKQGSQRRKKAVQRVAKLHQHLANQRRDFHHKTARSLVRRFGKIAHEDLNVQGIARSRLAKSTLDAGWTQFLSLLHSKAACAGVEVKAVNPRNTTQRCSSCGGMPETPLKLSHRVYRCVWCGHIADRDHNAAVNIRNQAWTVPSVANVSR